MKLSIFLSLFLFSTVIFGQTAVEITTQQQVDSLVALNRDLVSKNQFEEALRVIEQAEQLALSSFGRESAAFGTCRHNHARTFQNGGKLDEAVTLYLEVLDLRAKVLGKINADYATSLSNLGGIYATKGDYAKAEPLFTEVVEIRAQTLGKENPDYLSSLGALALIYVMNGDYDQGEPLLAEVVEISARTLGKENAVYLNNLDYLAKIYSETGDFVKAEPLYIESRTIKAKVFGEQHTVYIGSLINLAILYASLKDDYSLSEQLYLKAIGLYRKEPMKKDLNYMTCLTNLGGIYVKNGDYSKAESFYLECLEIQAKTMSKAHPNYAGTLINLASLYTYKNEYAKSEALLLEARNIFEIVLNDKSHPFYVNCLMNLGSLYVKKQEYQKAEPLLLEVKEIRSKASKLASFSVINNLGSLYGDMGEYAKAEAQASEAKEIVIKNLGKECMEYGICLFNYYPLYQITNRIPLATATLLELINLDHYLVEQSSAYMSENQMHGYLQKYVQHTYRYFSFLQTNSSPELLRNTYNHALFFNRYLLENTRRLTAGMDLATPAIRDTFERWQGCRRRLAGEYAKPISERRSIASVESEAEGYEKTLTRHVSAFAETRKQPHWNEVRDRLHTGEVAIEFVRYPFFNPRETDSVMYAAFVLLPDSQEPRFIPLFEEKSLDSMLTSSAARKADYVNAVYGFKTETNNPRAQKSLYELLWKPLEKDLAGIRTVYFSPSGLLHRLNLNAIPINEKELLSDRYHLVEMGSSRQLVIASESVKGNTDSGKALLFGGVQYDLNADALTAQNIDFETNTTGNRGELSFSFTDSTDRGGTWNYLKWTDKEVTALEPILKSVHIQPTIRKGYGATEEVFKSIGVGQPSPRILHIATHGFFFPDPSTTSVRINSPQFGTEPSFKISEHPMIRSGLILAGANQAWKTGKPFKPGMEDGILTAYEISQMDLSNTELVVLSACETGLGDIQGNEGVYGLQRAFKIAGAKYLIMSLWQVPDFQTQELMTVFYTNWLTKKLPIPDAFRAAQQTMREKYEHPYFWAGFVLVE